MDPVTLIPSWMTSKLTITFYWPILTSCSITVSTFLIHSEHFKQILRARTLIPCTHSSENYIRSSWLINPISVNCPLTPCLPRSWQVDTRYISHENLFDTFDTLLKNPRFRFKWVKEWHSLLINHKKHTNSVSKCCWTLSTINKLRSLCQMNTHSTLIVSHFHFLNFLSNISLSVWVSSRFRCLNLVVLIFCQSKVSVSMSVSYLFNFISTFSHFFLIHSLTLSINNTAVIAEVFNLRWTLDDIVWKHTSLSKQLTKYVCWPVKELWKKYISNSVIDLLWHYYSFFHEKNSFNVWILILVPNETWFEQNQTWGTTLYVVRFQPWTVLSRVHSAVAKDRSTRYSFHSPSFHSLFVHIVTDNIISVN